MFLNLPFCLAPFYHVLQNKNEIEILSKITCKNVRSKSMPLRDVVVHFLRTWLLAD